MFKRFFRLSVLWFFLGAAYFLLEFIWRLPSGAPPHPAMIAVGGTCGIMVGGINQKPQFYKMPIILQSLAGTIITLLIEYISGLILNVLMQLNIWDYTGMPGSILGQICLPFAFAWFLIMPLAIWLEDRLRWGFGWDGKSYSLLSAYHDLLLLR